MLKPWSLWVLHVCAAVIIDLFVTERERKHWFEIKVVDKVLWIIDILVSYSCDCSDVALSLYLKARHLDVEAPLNQINNTKYDPVIASRF